MVQPFQLALIFGSAGGTRRTRLFSFKFGESFYGVPVTLFGGLAVPPNNLGLISRRPPAILIRNAKFVLSLGVALFGGLQEPFPRLGPI